MGNGENSLFILVQSGYELSFLTLLVEIKIFQDTYFKKKNSRKIRASFMNEKRTVYKRNFLPRSRLQNSTDGQNDDTYTI